MNALKRFHNIHKGLACVIIGNGYSLNSTPLLDLASKYHTFGSNKIYRLPFTPDYYCIIDEEMLATCLPLPETFKPKEMFLRAEAGVGNPIYPIVAAGFGLDISNFVVMGGTVTFALLQIAFYMGFDTALLVGVDHNYSIPQNGKRFVAGKNDPDHFYCADGKPYFDEGRVFNPPELTGTTQAYAIAKEVFDKTGKKIINLTPGSKLDVFEKDVWDNWL